jgi:hypothetical protein
MLRSISKTLPVHPSMRHPLTGEPLAAVGIRRNGDPIWPVLGAAEDDAGGDGGDDEGSGDDTDSGDADEDDEGADKLGDAGKKALDRMKAQLKAERLKRRQAEKDRDDVRNGQTKDDTDADKVRRDAESAATNRANERILRAEVKAAAGGKLADPADAVRLLDLSQFELDSDGDVDEDEIAEAIDDLLKKKPYLAAQGGTKDERKTLKGDRSQGARGKDTAPTVAAGAARYAERHTQKT